MTNGKAEVQPSAAPLAPANDTMRRLQIGIAGVLTVLLLVGMAGLIGDRAQERAANDAAAGEIKISGDTQKSSGAPLEELGVQAVSKDQNAVTPVKVPQAAPTAPTSTVPDLEPDPTLERVRQSKQ